MYSWDECFGIGFKVGGFVSNVDGIVLNLCLMYRFCLFLFCIWGIMVLVVGNDSISVLFVVNLLFKLFKVGFVGSVRRS